MTPEEAQALEPGTTPGPWEWKDDCSEGLGARAYDSLGNDTHHALETQDAEDYASWVVASDEDKALIAAAPEMRTIIASLRWEYAIESQWSTGDWANTTGWFPTPERAQAELFLDDMPTRLIRRLVGNAEEAPK